MKSLKRRLMALWALEAQIRGYIALSRWVYRRIPLVGKVTSLFLDRLLLVVYAIDLRAIAIDVKALSISHPVGVLLGGNGIYSPGRVAVMSGVKFVAHSPDHPEYLRRHAEKRVFVLGDNVVLGANTVVIGPVTVCSGVLVGAMSLVNRDITEPGVYVGTPVRKVADRVTDEWVRHLA